MAKLRKNMVDVARLLYIDPVSGEVRDANEAIQSLQAYRLHTDNFYYSDEIARAYRGAVTGILSTQPQSAVDGARYLIANDAAGFFSLIAKKIVTYIAETDTWEEEALPRAGSIVFSIEDDKFYKFTDDDFAVGVWMNILTGSHTGGSPGTPIYANAQGMLDSSYLDYDVDFDSHKISVRANFQDSDPSDVIVNKGYVDGKVASLHPGVLYTADNTVTKAGQLVCFSDNNRTVTQLLTSQSKEALGLTVSAPSGGQVRVLSDTQKIIVPLSRLDSGAVGHRVFLKTDGSGDFTTTVPTTGGHRIWQVGVIASVDETEGSPTEGYTLNVLVKFIRVNGAAA